MNSIESARPVQRENTFEVSMNLGTRLQAVRGAMTEDVFNDALRVNQYAAAIAEAAAGDHHDTLVLADAAARMSALAEGLFRMANALQNEERAND